MVAHRGGRRDHHRHLGGFGDRGRATDRRDSGGSVISLSDGGRGDLAHQLAMDAGGHTLVVWKWFDGAHDRVMVTSRD